jgi:hypothetical protein
MDDWFVRQRLQTKARSSSIRHHVTICVALGSTNICLLLLSFSVHAIGSLANKHVPACKAGIIEVVVYG